MRLETETVEAVERATLLKNKKKQHGITLVSLIITIVLILIITGTTVYTSVGRFKINNMQKMFNDIELLEDKVENYYLRYGGLPVVRDENNNPVKYNYSDISNITKNESSNKYIKKLDYIESTGTQYIDTELKVKEGLSVELKARVNSKYHSDGTIFLGGQESLSSMNFFIGIGWTWRNCSFGYGNGFKQIANVQPKTNEDITIKTTGEDIEINGVTCTGIKNNNVGTFNGTEYNIYLFTRNNAGNIDERRLAGRIYYCKIWDDDTLVRDYVPVIDENNVACLYDKAEGKYYYNAGTGEFKTNLEEGGTITYESVIEKGGYHIIDLSAIGNITLNYGKEGYENPNSSDDVYIINEKTHNIYYVKGIEYVDGKFYHSKKVNGDNNADILPPTKPEINILSGTKLDEESNVYTSNVEVEIIPGKDNNSGVDSTVYTIKSNEGNETIATKKITERTVIKLDISNDYIIQVKTTNNAGNISSTESKLIISKIDYIESTGTQYIDTEIVPSNNLKIIINTSYTKITAPQGNYILGSDSSYYSGINICWDSTITQGYRGVFGNDLLSTKVIPVFNENVELILENNRIKLNNELKAEYNSSDVSEFSNQSIYLFCTNRKGTAFCNSACRIYYCKFYDGDTLVRDYIPVLDENGVACLFDKVEGKYYYNAGTGEFKTNLDE